jgi:hypothetical protein
MVARRIKAAFSRQERASISTLAQLDVESLS